MMNAIVTGAGGHLGFHVAKELLSRGINTHLLIRRENANTDILRASGAVVQITDLKSDKYLTELLTGKDVLFHLAAENTTDHTNHQKIIDNTYELTRIVIRAAIDAKVKTIVYTSSVVVFGRSETEQPISVNGDLTSNAESPYVEGKLLAEKYCRSIADSTDADIRIIYPSWILGQNDLKGTPPHDFIKKYLESNQKYYFGGGISVAHVTDVAKGHVEVWQSGKIKGKYILAGHNITFRELYETLSAAAHKTKPKFRLPKSLMVMGSYLLQLLPGNRNIPSPGYIKSIVDRYSWYDSKEAISLLNYNIRPLKEIIESGIKQSCNLLHRTQSLSDRYTQAETLNYDSDDVLLITGFPGWLSTRMVDIMINGDTFGNNKIKRRIKLLSHTQIPCHYDLPPNFEVVEGDLTDRKSLSHVLEGVKSVYHLAAVIYSGHKKRFYDINYQGTKNLVDACIEKKIRRIVFASTDSICGYSKNKKPFSDDEPARPYKHYGRSKQLAEDYLIEKTKSGQIDGTILRGFWFFGPNAPERVSNFYSIFRWKRQPVFGTGKNLRSITHTDDLIRAFIDCEKNTQSFGKWYWISEGTGELTVDEIYLNIAKAMEVDYKPIYIHEFVCNLMSLADSLLSTIGIMNSYLYAAGKFHRNIAAKSDKATNDFGYMPKSGFLQIKKEITQFAKSNQHNKTD